MTASDEMRAAREPPICYPMLMNTIDENQAWKAFERRDRSWDGRVIGAVKTTGIYCKPSCPARRPKRENVEFFVDAEVARAAAPSGKNSTFSRFGRRAGQLGRQ